MEPTHVSRGDVLVLDGDENQAVACTRDLGRAGLRVVVGERFALPKASFSRFAAARLRYRSPRTDPEGFVRDLASAVGPLVDTGTVLLPMTEATTLAVSNHRSALSAAGYRLVLPAHEDLLAAFSKQMSSAIASSCGLEVPKQVLVTDAMSAIEAYGLHHPVVVKAVTSNKATANGLVLNPRPRYSMDADHTKHLLRQALAEGDSVIVQEFVLGSGVGFFGLYDSGHIERSFAHRRLRDVHPTGSGSSYRESMPVSPELMRAGTAVLDALRWHGAAMVEFRQRPNGQLVFLEVNGRLWNSLALAVAAGAPFPRWLAQLARSEALHPPQGFSAGVRARWILGDVRHLLAVARGRPAGFPGEFPALSETIGGMFRGVGSDHFDNLQADDPLPEFGDWLSAGRKLVRRLVQC